MIESDDQATDSKRSHSSRLGVLLLNPGNVTRDVLDRNGIFDCQSVRLTFGTRTVNQDARIGGETCVKASERGESGKTIPSKEVRNVGQLPANPSTMWSSSKAVLRTVLGSWSWRTLFFSTARTTQSLPRTPTAQVPFLTASRA